MSSVDPKFYGYEFSHGGYFGHLWEWKEPVRYEDMCPKDWKMLIHDKNGNLVYSE